MAQRLICMEKWDVQKMIFPILKILELKESSNNGKLKINQWNTSLHSILLNLMPMTQMTMKVIKQIHNA